MANILKYRPNKIAFFVFLFSLIISQSIAYKIFKVEKRNELLQLKHEAESVKHQLESSLNHSVTATKVISFLVDKDLLDDFDVVAGELIKQNKHIDALQLVKGSEIIKTFPLEGNEPAIGFSIFDDPTHKKEALKAIERKSLYFEGPFNLKQGGKGVVGRLPIFKNGVFWGFSAVIIRIQTIVDALHLNEYERNENYDYQIAKKQTNNGGAIPFFSKVTDYNFGYYQAEFVTLGDWEVYVKLKSPKFMLKAIPPILVGLIFSVLLALFIRYVADQPYKLKILVAEKTKELQKTNAELEQFAYVASHDLQEPLRMISGFLTLIDKKYSDSLDEKGKSYIKFAVDGSVRMRKIILDLLDFSKNSQLKNNRSNLDLNNTVGEVQKLLAYEIQESKANFIVGKLPILHSCNTPLRQVFQNLISNAIKYRRAGVAPIIHINAKEEPSRWIISINDNGIGINSEYFDKIFVLFQRLHSQDQYSGTGMGLALVKKIIENAGGQIWLESTEGKGTTFFFSIPKQ
ncbi:MAG: ATP-binding protein [Flavobacteriales bacterium]